MADLFSALGSIGSGLLDNLFANRRQEDQQAFNAQQFATRYQTTVKDMQAAGLNPMLAYSQGGGSGASSGIGSSSGSMTQGFSAYQANQTQRELNDAQIESLKTQAELNSANAAKAVAEARSSNVDADVKERYGVERGGYETEAARVNVGSIVASTNKALADTALSLEQKHVAMQTAIEIAERIKNIPKEGARLEAAARELQTQADLNKQRGLTEVDQRKLLAAQAARVIVDTDLSSLDLRAASDTSNIQRIVKQFGPAAQMLLDILNYMKPRGGITINR